LTDAITRQAEQMKYLKDKIREYQAHEHEKDKALRRAQQMQISLEATNRHLKDRLEEEYSKQDALEKWATAKAEGIIDAARIEAAQKGIVPTEEQIAAAAVAQAAMQAQAAAALPQVAASIGSPVPLRMSPPSHLRQKSLPATLLTPSMPINRSERTLVSGGSRRELSPLRPSAPSTSSEREAVPKVAQGAVTLQSTATMDRHTLQALKKMGADLSLREKENSRLLALLDKQKREVDELRSDLDITKRLLNKAKQNEKIASVAAALASPPSPSAKAKYDDEVDTSFASKTAKNKLRASLPAVIANAWQHQVSGTERTDMLLLSLSFYFMCF